MKNGERSMENEIKEERNGDPSTLHSSPSIQQWPRVGIVLVNYNSYNDTSRCLESLEAMTYPNAEIIVVDNGSRDHSGTRLQEEFPGTTFLFSKENTGFTGGNNIGTDYALDAGCDHVLLLNNDTMVTPGFLEPLVERMESDPKIAAVSGKIYYAPEQRNGEADIIWYAGCYRKWHMGYHHYGVEEKDTGKYEDAREIPYASGCLMLMRGSVIRQLGTLCDDFFIYWEEADWCHRARDAGYTCVYEPKSIIYHNFKSAALGHETPFHMYMQYRNAFIYAKKHYHGFEGLQYWLFYPLYIANRIRLDLRAKNTRAAKATLWGVRDYFRGFKGRKGLKERGFLQA